MLVRLFGGVTVYADGDWIPAGPAKRQCVLAALAVAPGTPVSLTELTARVWGSAAPSSAHSSLYGHMTWLRRLLPDSFSRAGVDGYRLDLDPDLVDVHRLRRWCGARR